MKVWGLFFLLAGALAAPAQAAVITFEIKDIGTFATYTDTNVGQTFPGTGFVGMYNTVAEGQPAFVHLLGIESTDYSRTNMQVGTGVLAGATITSAVLRFTLLDGGNSQVLSGTAYSASGDLGYQWEAPAGNYGGFSGPAVLGANAFDVTSLLAASVGAGDAWFGLHLQGANANTYIWTYTYADFGYSDDRALVRLDVTYDDAPVPEPGTMLLISSGLTALALRRRRAS